MGEKYLIDSNSVVDYLGKKLPDSGMVFMNPIIDAVANISVITKIEVLGFRMTENEHEKLLEDFMHDAVVLALNDLVIDKTIQIRREHKIKLPDAIIAATALVYDFTLITRNTTDFTDICKVINPWNQ
jgi:predicted nucleic acid-binding protein